jgi:hypothetical protein
MAATVPPEMPLAEAIAAWQWLPAAELAVYSGEFKHTGFQGGLQRYSCRTCLQLRTLKNGIDRALIKPSIGTGW